MLGDQTAKNLLYICTALSPYKKGAEQSKETFVKVFIKIYFWGWLGNCSFQVEWKQMGCVGIFFLLLHINAATRHD